jgi:hypothetical protein
LFHDELFAAYPKLRDVKLIVNDREQLRHFSFFGVPDAGAYSKEKNCIRINYLTLERSGIESLHSIFIHEIQHAIQAIEGFSYGSNTNQFDTLFKDTEDITEFMNLYEEYTQYRGKKKMAEWLSMPANFRRIKSQAIKNIVNQFKNGELGRFEAFDNLWEFHKQHYENIGKKQDAYKRTGGEVEARNAAFRMGMTPEERRASLAAETEDVVREDQIFLYDSLVNSNEVTTGNTTFANSKQNMTIVQMLEGTTPIETPKHDFKNIAEARSWAKENITGTYYNVNAGEDISVSRTSIDKYLSESAIKKSVDLDAHLSALKKLPQLIENSVLVERHPDRDSDNHIKEIQRLYSAINYKGKIFP